MIYLQLFWEFFKTGLFAIGGGMATVPFLFDISARTGWFTTSELANMIAVSESTPGPIGINMATYVGFETAGLLGGLIATLGLMAPSVIISIVIVKVLMHFMDKPVVGVVFKHIRPAVIGLILFAFWQLASLTFIGDGETVNWLSLVAFMALLALMLSFKKVHPIVWIAVGAVFGVVFL